MSGAPERIGYSYGHAGHMVRWLAGPFPTNFDEAEYVLASAYEAERALNAELVEALRGAEVTIRSLRIAFDATRGLSMEDSLKAFEQNAAPIRAALAKAEERESDRRAE